MQYTIDDVWILSVELKTGVCHSITTTRGQEKKYRTLDAVYVDVQRITGFSPDLSVDFSRYFAGDIDAQKQRQYRQRLIVKNEVFERLFMRYLEDCGEYASVMPSESWVNDVKNMFLCKK